METAVSVPSLLLAAFLLAVVFLDESRADALLGINPRTYALVTASASALNFCAVLLLLFFQPTREAYRHRSAVEHYSRIKHVAEELLNQDGTTKEDVNALRSRYIDVAGLPSIPGRTFNRLKRVHLIKVEVSRELTRNPHRTIRQIKKELRQKQGRA